MTLYPNLLLFGDSITQHAFSPSGFAATLAHTYSRKLDIINRGLSGYNTSQALRLLQSSPTSIIPPNTQLMTIFFGANDACEPGCDQHVPLAKFSDYLGKIIEVARSRDVKRIVVIGAPPICEHKTWIRDQEKGRHVIQRTAEGTYAYGIMAKEVAKKYNVPFLPTWNLFMKEAGWKDGDPYIGKNTLPQNAELGDLLHDGLHLSSKGYELLSRNLLKLIVKTWPEMDPDYMEMHFQPFPVAPWMEGDKVTTIDKEL